MGAVRKNDAEHSWHLALMAVLLKGICQMKKLTWQKVIPMVLLHDLVEIDAGDTYAYDRQDWQRRERVRQKAADRIFGMLPEDQGTKFRNLWEEFEAYETAEAKFAHVLDNCQPLLLNDASGGKSWKEHTVHKSQIYKRNEHTAEGSREI